MPELDDSDDLDLDLDGDEPDEGADDGADDGDGADDKDGKPPKKDEDKRTRELQSKADKAEARANKLEKELQKVRGEGASDGDKDPERAALLAELRESGLDAVYAENPELKTYGIARDLITGASRAEMRETASAVVALIKGVETKVRNETLRKHGITPEPSGTNRPPPKNYSEMSAEDIEKEISRAKSGGAKSLW